MHITKYIASSVPGRAEALSVVRSQQEQQKLEKLLIRKDQDAKRIQELLYHTNRGECVYSMYILLHSA